MPSAMQYVDPNDKLRANRMYFTDTLERNRVERFEKMWEYYYGNQKKFLKIRENEPDDNVILNLIKLTADRTVSYLFPQQPIVEVDFTTDVTNDEIWINNVFQYNGGLSFFHKLALIGFMSGHVYVRVVPQNPYPKLVIVHPKNIKTYWYGTDITEVLWHELSWTINDVNYIIDFIRTDDNNWLIREYTATKGSAYTLVQEAVWQSEYSPIVQWQHLPNPATFYGTPESEGLPLQDIINLALSETTRILRHHASPRTIAFGVEGEDIQETAIDELWAIEDTNARVENLEMQSDLSASMKLIQFLFDNYLSISRTIIVKGEAKDFQRVTNTGVRTLFNDVTAKRNSLLGNYDQAIKDIVARCFIVAGKGFKSCRVTHFDPLPTDELEKQRVNQLKIQLGLASRRQLVEQEGVQTWDSLLSDISAEYEMPFFNQIDPNTQDGSL